MLDEPRTFGAQALDDMAVVHDLVANVDRRTEPLERVLDDIDRTNHTRAKSARLREHHMHELTSCGRKTGTFTSRCRENDPPLCVATQVDSQSPR